MAAPAALLLQTDDYQMHFVVPRQLRPISANTHYNVVMSVCGSLKPKEVFTGAFLALTSFSRTVSWTVSVFDAEIVPQPINIEGCGESCRPSEKQKFKWFAALGKQSIL